MNTQETPAIGCCGFPSGKTKGEIFEGIAFTFCKTALVILLARQFALTVASGAAAIFYVIAVVSGKKDTRCWARWPLAIALFWAIVCGVSIYARLK